MAMLFNLRVRPRFASYGRKLAVLSVFTLAFAAANAQPIYQDLHDFSGKPDGANPYGGVAFDASGNAYGTTRSGGANALGMVWEITIAGVFKDIHDFGGMVTNAGGSTGADGEYPYASVSVDNQGDVFGTTLEGGQYGGGDLDGMVWEITVAGAYKDLHDFGGTITYADGSSGIDGYYPFSGVTIDSSGNIYGATSGGALNSDGLIWEITAAGVFKDLHDFGGSDGASPYGNVSIDSSGNLYGTTETGGGNHEGLVWELETGGTFKDLHDFGGTVTLSNGSSGLDGENPYTGITLDASGDMFGTAKSGGGNATGVVWEITKAGSYKDLHDFGGTVTNADGSSGTDGEDPVSGVALDSAGDIFGTTKFGGPSNVGMVWEVQTGGTYLDLHDFGGTVTNANGATGPDGNYPDGTITSDSTGDLYGTAYQGSPNGDGLVWRLLGSERVISLTLNPGTIGGLGTTTATVTLAAPAPIGGTAVNVHAGASGYLNMPATVTVPAGATSATFTITGTAQRPATINMGVFAGYGSSSVEAVLTIQGDSLKSFTLSPSQIKWTSGTSTATLTIASAAPPGGWNVTLTPGVSGYVTMPTTVTIPAGSTSTTFSMTGNALRFFTLNLGILASDGGSKATATLIVAGDAVKSLSLSPSTIGWGGTSTATVNLVAPAPPGGWLVNTNPGAKGYVTMPSSITVPAGATSATFTVTAGSQRSSNLSIGIYANDGPSNQSATLTIQGDSVKSLTLNPSSIAWTGTSTATVTLSSAAPPGGWVLTMHAGASGYVTMPTTLTVPAGATTATFTITAGSQRSSTLNLGIFVSDGNSSQEAILTIT